MHVPSHDATTPGVTRYRRAGHHSRAWVAAIFICTCTGAVYARGADAELRELEKAWNDAHQRGDADALDRLWHDDLQVRVPRMAPMGKPDSLRFMRSGRMNFQRYETSDLVIRHYGDTAIVTGRLKRSRTLGGKQMDDDWLFTKVYVRQDGQLRIVAFHASDAP